LSICDKSENPSTNLALKKLNAVNPTPPAAPAPLCFE
jgi:hypothetical protein